MTKEELEKHIGMTMPHEDWEMFIIDSEREQKLSKKPKKKEKLEISTRVDKLTELRIELLNNRKKQDNIGDSESEMETYAELLTRESQIEEEIEEIERLNNSDYTIIEERCPNCGGIGFGSVAEGFICKSCLYNF